MSRLRGVVIGAGYFSQFHFDAWARIAEVDLVAVCDLDPNVAQQAARKYGIAAHYGDVAEALDNEQPDFVDIVTRPESHLEIVSQAAQRGLAIICQKALAPTYHESRRIVELATSAGVTLMVHENFRFQPWYREIRRQIDRGQIGDRLHSITFQFRTGDGWQPDAYLARQPYFRTMPRLLIFETGVHFVDTFRYLAGEIDGVYASLRQLNAEIVGEDTGVVMFEFASGAEGCWDANRYNEPLSQEARFTFGQALVEGTGGSLRLRDDGQLILHRLGQAPERVNYRVENRGFAGDCVLATQQHFVHHLQTGEPCETSGSEYLKTLRVVEAIYASAEQRLPIRGLTRAEE